MGFLFSRDCRRWFATLSLVAMALLWSAAGEGFSGGGLGLGARAASAATPVKTYTVRRGDTLSGIARRFGVSVKQIQAWSGLRTTLIRPGQRLVVGRGTSAPDAGYDPRLLHVVRQGETIEVLAGRYGLTPQEILAANPGKSVAEGATLLMPWPSQPVAPLARDPNLPRSLVAGYYVKLSLEDSLASSTVKENRVLLGEILDGAAAHKPDLVLLTETFLERGTSESAEQAAEPIPGPTTNLLAEKARRLHSWVAMSLHERDGRDVFNTAVLVDREGRIAAKYRKIHLTLDEFERGITPGGDYTVVDTDFAKVGLLVCWDHWFPEAARILRLKGAELLLLPIAGDGESHWDVVSRARAIDNGVYIASAIAAGKPASRIVSPEGEVLAETTGGYAAADLDFNRETRVEWLSVGPAEGEAKSLYIKERRPDTYGPLLPDRDGGR